MEVNDTEKIVVMLFNSNLFVKLTPLNGSRGGAFKPITERMKEKPIQSRVIFKLIKYLALHVLRTIS